MAHRLPREVITHILSFLNVSDRKEAAMVCRHWYDASLDPILQTKVAVHLQPDSSSSRLESLLRRKTPHLVLKEFDASLSSTSFILNSCEKLFNNLKSLSLKGSTITEKTFVQLLSCCRSLERLDLSCSDSLFMTGILLAKDADVQKLKTVLVNLKEVNLSSIRYISDVSFNRVMSICPNIECLSLSKAPISFKSGYAYSSKKASQSASNTILSFENVLNFIASSSHNLKSLDFSRTGINDEALVSLAEVEGLNLTSVSLMCCRDVTDKGIFALCHKNQDSLMSVDLRECFDTTDSSLRSITDVPLMETLMLGKCKRFTDASVKTMKKLTHLKYLDLSENMEVSSVGLIEGLCGNISLPLEYLKLNSCPSVSDSFVLSLCKVKTALVHLDLGSCCLLGDPTVIAISEHLPNLKFLRLAWCKNITDLGLLGYEKVDKEDQHQHEEEGLCRCTRKYNSTEIFRKPTGFKKGMNSGGQNDREAQTFSLKRLSHLRELDLSSCQKITDLSLTQVLEFNELQSLNLGMLHITDKTLHTIAKNNPSIEVLKLGQCGALTDEGMTEICRSLTRLTTLDITSCDKLTNVTIENMKRYSKRLRVLHLSFCKNITVSAVDDLQRNLDLQDVQRRLIGGSFKG